ncbi:TMAO/DMSO reductase [Halomonas elongata]|uniref:TMAO/DMSO reductase n=1 Tax=Halomonas elongata TaxID=2746 RepID=A0A1B8NZR0_HALEL|nr:TMAO/DMSO reductase [Halomonas elongata]
MTRPDDPNRRRFLGRSLLAGGALLLGGCERVTRSDAMQSLFDASGALTQKAHRLLASQESLAREYAPDDIAPEFRANGTTDPTSADYRRLAANAFSDWHLSVDGLVDHASRFSLTALRDMPARTQITRHDCVEGWSCIGQWTGVPLGDVLDRVGVRDTARFVVFHCADRYGGGDPTTRAWTCARPITPDAAGLRPQRRRPAHRQRRTAAAARRAATGLQDGQVRHATRTGGKLRPHRTRPRRFLGGQGI